MVWIVLAVILLIILTLIFSPVKIFVNYQNGKTSIIIKYLFIKKNVNQIRKRKKNLKKSKSEEHNRDESRQKKSKFRNIIPEDNKEKTEFVLNINILYWKDAKREDAQINFTGFDGLLLYLDETCEQNGVLLRKAQVRRNQKRRLYLEAGKELELVKKSEHAAVFWLKVMGREFASFQGIVHIWGRDYPYRSGFELIILLKDIVGFTERRSVRKNWKAERN